ncbi:Dynein beta chain, flagellar outer arm [Auxenochlorella protothecoides]|uniref:Dynein beta chain, flagellar outer arm n=1 Tax=Auxenochlorella protothecoides TaxID=3075 RepID=A0A087SCT2_AUXPR|nr:Dynein beta chain, flagellar outer arm [Auxenochlorella protothecoides]KFM23536.1 Dynein beta chain, flagellar outer arm [Auxenochlorella protothecoides]
MELSRGIQEQLAVLSSRVFIPMLQAQARQALTGAKPCGGTCIPPSAARTAAQALQQYVLKVNAAKPALQPGSFLVIPDLGSAELYDGAPDAPTPASRDLLAALDQAAGAWIGQLREALAAIPVVPSAQRWPRAPAFLAAWAVRAESLQGLRDQAAGPGVQRALALLRANASPRLPALERLLAELREACPKAASVARHAAALGPRLAALAGAGVQHLPQTFRPVMLTAILMWQHCPDLRAAPGLMLSLLRHVTDDIAESVRQGTEGTSILVLEGPEAVRRLELCLHVLGTWKSMYLEMAAQHSRTPTKGASMWRFPPATIFSGMDELLERAHDVLGLVNMAARFARLETLELGGSKGRELTASLHAIQTEFKSVLTTMQEALDGCGTVAASFHVLGCFSAWLHREPVAQELQHRYVELVSMFGKEVGAAAVVFREQRSCPLVGPGMAPFSGAVAWSRGIQERIRGGHQGMASLPLAILNSKGGREVQRAYGELLAELKAFEAEQMELWEAEVDVTSASSLMQPLIRMHRNEGLTQVAVNFDPRISELLQEVATFLGQPDLPRSIPGTALQVHAQASVLQLHVSQLESVVNAWNHMQDTMIPEERAIVDALIIRARLSLEQCSQATSGRIQEILDGWLERPLFERKDGKVFSNLELDASMKGLMTMRLENTAFHSSAVVSILSEAVDSLSIIRESQPWRDYLAHVAGQMLEGLAAVVLASARRLLGVICIHDAGQQCEGRDFHAALQAHPAVQRLYADVTLAATASAEACTAWKAVWTPFEHLWKQTPKSVLQEYLAADEVLDQAGFLSRFEMKVQQLHALSEQIQALPATSTLGWLRVDARLFKQSLLTCASKLSHAFTRHLQTQLGRCVADMSAFITSAATVLNDAIAAPGAGSAQPSPAPSPSIKPTSRRGTASHSPSAGLAASLGASSPHSTRSSLAGSLLGQARPKRQSIKLAAGLGVRGEASLDSASLCTPRPPVSGESRKERYLAALHCGQEVRARTKEIAAQLVFADESAALLERSGAALSAGVQNQVEAVAREWRSLQKKLLHMKEALAHFISAETQELHRAVIAYRADVEAHRMRFTATAPYAVTAELTLACVSPALDVLQGLEHDGGPEGLMGVGRSLKARHDLLDLPYEPLASLSACKSEATALRGMWDMIARFLSSHEEWRAQSWTGVDAESLGEMCKAQSKELKSLSKTAIGARFELQTGTLLGEVLDLKLHRHAAKCEEVLEQVQREVVVEMALAKVASNWAEQRATFVDKPGQGVALLTVADAVVELLENDTLTLQGLASSKFVLGDVTFQGAVQAWQQRLMTTDAVLSSWTDVQRLWQDYLETKRLAFPRFYFVAPADLLDILANASQPQAIVSPFALLLTAYDELARDRWIFEHSAQTTITVSRTYYTHEVDAAFDAREDGNENALKELHAKLQAQVSELIARINGKLTPSERQKLITLCTVDVHARDVVQRLIEEKVDSVNAFQWQSQLRYYQSPQSKECMVSICDADIEYGYEYIGNCGCLCITPLTDRCYITLTQAQRLHLGGAPAGPAGTGKTETTKDLARALGVQCYVFNCSDQMDYLAMGQIYKGLAQTGAWGCFDEFNRIPVSVLSVCSTQYKTLLDALRAKKDRFVFEGTEIPLRHSAMAFITMNPGYIGRAELPESLKALFRPVSMAAPDLTLICEIMLMAEGFQEAKTLARKFITLYKLCEDLLSKSKHYDWKLRAIKTTLYVAGGMKRAAPELSEEKVLLRALRDFNLGKLTADDVVVFNGLLGDLFPSLPSTVPRSVDQEFESMVKVCARELGYQPEPNFCLKVSQLKEIFSVRWSVFLLGNAGCGKSAVWRTLARTLNAMGQKTVWKPINPKSVTRNELYGFIHPQTREWKEGLISSIFREMASNKTCRHQWIVLDGDIDAEWIESMNTVMASLDDNKMLSLASNERIPLTDTMRLLLEINHMNYCSPATVSRGGVIYMNDPSRFRVEAHFVMACIWAFGGALSCDGAVDSQAAFSKWWRGEFKSVALPAEGTVFDYYMDNVSGQMVPWTQRIPASMPGPPLTARDAIQVVQTPEFVETVDTVRLRWLTETLVKAGHAVLLVGPAGTGKSAVMARALESMDGQGVMVNRLPLNSCHDGPSLQTILERPLEKKAGMRYGPRGSKRLIYWLDNVNMPIVDKYETQSALELIRQSIDYGGWYDKARIAAKEIMHTGYVACMDPAAGSGCITPRLQRHFATFAVTCPAPASAQSIFIQLTKPHFSGGFKKPVLEAVSGPLATAMVDLHAAVQSSLLPNSVKFHYNFNLRELVGVARGMRLASPNLQTNVLEITSGDEMMFKDLCQKVLRRHFLPFAEVGRKQSLARLAAHMQGLEAMQLSLTSSYGDPEFKMDILAMCRKAGVKNKGVAFLLNDGHVTKEDFLAHISDLMTSGSPASLCSQEDKEGFCDGVRAEVKASGLLDTADNCWDFFTKRVQDNLHLVLCFSPVNPQFRGWAQRFPALISIPILNWFRPWPESALLTVAEHSLNDVPALEAEALRHSVAQCMAAAHAAVIACNDRYLSQHGKHNHTTSKSFLEFVNLFKSLLAKKHAELQASKTRLQNGLNKIRQAAEAVLVLQGELAKETVVVEEKKAATQELIESIRRERAVVDEAVGASQADEEEAAALQREVTAFQTECAADLATAEPIIKEAEAALNSLDKASLGELKSFGSPAKEVVDVLAAVMILASSGGNIPKDLSWAAGKKFMGNVDAFLRSLLTFNKDGLHVPNVERVEKEYLSQPGFRPESIKSKSSAAAGLCAWVLNICKYFRVYQVVAPKRAALAEANQRLAVASQKLTAIRAVVADLNAKVAALESNLLRATEEKNTAISQADRTASKADISRRLIAGLAGENERWAATVAEMEDEEGTLLGRVLLTSAFITYAGAFNAQLRGSLVEGTWRPHILAAGIPLEPEFSPLDLLITSVLRTSWSQNGLPSDALSVENAAILTNASQWPLLIDPHKQGLKWLLAQEESTGMRVLQQDSENFMATVRQCIQEGIPLVIENLPEKLDPALDPVLQKTIVKKGGSHVWVLGDIEVDYNPAFRLYLQTEISSPHFGPEIAAQCTIVNFSVTPEGLEEQLLTTVAGHERPDLQASAAEIVRSLGALSAQLQSLEDDLLARLEAADGNILEDMGLVEGLEATKATAANVEDRVAEARENEAIILQSLETYRPVAIRAAIIFFIMDSLPALDRVYLFSMAAFVMSVSSAGGMGSLDATDTSARVQQLVVDITTALFRYMCQALFERHKLVAATQLCVRVLLRGGSVSAAAAACLTNGSEGLEAPPPNPLADWMSDSSWRAVANLARVSGFETLLHELVGLPKRWREWAELARPEEVLLPGEWKRAGSLERLLVLRALRPDRLTQATELFVASTLGPKFAASQPWSLDDAYKEPAAMRQLEKAFREGAWVLLQNIHLTLDWTRGALSTFVSQLPQRGAHANFRTIVFGLCYYHAVIIERKRFGVGNLLGATSGVGWNMNYPRLSRAYITSLFQEALLDGAEIFPGMSPPLSSLNHAQASLLPVLEWLSEALPPEAPAAYGLHANAALGSSQLETRAFSEALCSLQVEGDDRGKEEVVAEAEVDSDFMESERLNALLHILRSDLGELELGLRGDLAMSATMEQIRSALTSSRVPPSWIAASYPTMRNLASWLEDLSQRAQQLENWTRAMEPPPVVWLPGLFNPMAFLTAVLQTTARQQGWALDRTLLVTEVTRRACEAVSEPAREGAYIHGLTLEGAHWDEKAGCLEDARHKVLSCRMPVMHIRALPVGSFETRDVYECPVYATQIRFRQEVFSVSLRSKQPWTKWAKAGVCLMLEAPQL